MFAVVLELCGPTTGCEGRIYFLNTYIESIQRSTPSICIFTICINR